MRTYLISVVILLILAPVFGQSQEGKNDSVTAEEYAVYSVLLNEIKASPNDGKEAKLLVVNDRTEGPGKRCLPEEVAKWEKDIRAEELKALLADLLTKNDKQYSLSQQFKRRPRSEFKFPDCYATPDCAVWSAAACGGLITL